MQTPVFGSDKSVVLKVEVMTSSGKQYLWNVRCNPQSGNHPELKSVCSNLKVKSVRSFFNYTKPDLCTQIYGGAARASVIGSIYGKAVRLSIDKRDGCGIALWKQLDFILVKK